MSRRHRREDIKGAIYILLGFIAVLIAASWANGAAITSSGPRSALLAWGAVTTYTDGTPIEGEVTYRIYAGPGESRTIRNNIAETTALSILLENEPLGQRCYQVSAYVTARGLSSEGMPSPDGCKVMRLSAPTEGSIEAPTDGAIENE